MKTRIPVLAAVLLLVVAPAFAQDNFPGLKAVLTEAEWKRAGLDRLTPDELGVIDAALIRREAGLAAQQHAALASAQPAAPAIPVAGSTPPPPGGLWSHFGLFSASGPSWRDVPPLKARVVKWETPNRFVLDNNQAWESNEPIIYDLIGKEIEIQARPNNQFALTVEGINTTLRVMRVR